jgi:ethanolamine ammonia-lyase small subunit
MQPAMPSDPGIVPSNESGSNELRSKEWHELAERIHQQTPARLMEGRSGTSYLTATQLQLRADHAAARDAVQAELDLVANLGQQFVERWQLFEVSTRAASKSEYLLRPDLGRSFDEAARSAILAQCPHSPVLQIVIGDGLSIKAVSTQLPELLPLLFDGAGLEGAGQCGWSVGRPFVVRHCRVGIMNEIGELLNPQAVVLLVGERPGLATAESLSAYLAFRPRHGHTDADRNLVSNIHRNGVPPAEATTRIVGFVRAMLREGKSGVQLKEPIKEPTQKTRIISE